MGIETSTTGKELVSNHDSIESAEPELTGTGCETIKAYYGQSANVADVPAPAPTPIKKKKQTKLQKVAAKLIRLQNKLEAAYDKGHASKSVERLNMLIRKTNRELAMLKMKKYD